MLFLLILKLFNITDTDILYFKSLYILNHSTFISQETENLLFLKLIKWPCNFLNTYATFHENKHNKFTPIRNRQFL